MTFEVGDFVRLVASTEECRRVGIDPSCIGEVGTILKRSSICGTIGTILYVVRFFEVHCTYACRERYLEHARKVSTQERILINARGSVIGMRR